MVSSWNLGAMLVPKLWMMSTYGAHDIEIGSLKLDGPS
jgi:hypothetical protein